VALEVLQELPRALEAKLGLLLGRLGDVPLPVREVVLAVVLGAARPTVVMPLTSVLTAPRELLERFQLSAPAAAFHRSPTEPPSSDVGVAS
jgi:hypothetical protein